MLEQILELYAAGGLLQHQSMDGIDEKLERASENMKPFEQDVLGRHDAVVHDGHFFRVRAA